MHAMTLFDAAVLGLVEGITEFLPISSTAHLMFASALLGLPQSAFIKSFEVAIQLGAILAVVALYWRKFLDMRTLARLGVAFAPTAAVGLALYPFIKGALIGNTPVALLALGAGGAALIAFEYAKKGAPEPEPRELSFRQAALVGLAQAAAVVPGVSRSAATIVGGLALGVSRRTIVEFSFLLAVPTMGAATALDLYKNAGEFSRADWGAVGAGFAVSFVVALISIRWLLKFVRTHDFTSFGIYRMLAAALFALLLLR
jgi:undecaprenyl-diphosphatase